MVYVKWERQPYALRAGTGIRPYPSHALAHGKEVKYLEEVGG